MSRFVRSSKYRHVFGRPTRKEQCYDNLHISKNAWDSNIIKVNPKYISVNWEAGGGGAFAVIPLSERGKLPDQIPLFRGHTAVVLDTDWNPFNDSIIASGSDDGKVFVWKVPDDFTLHIEDDQITSRDVGPQVRLAGHSKKVGHVLFHPAADSVLATSSGDFTVKIWDIESGQARLTLKHLDVVQSLSFNGNGSLLVTTCRDKKLRIWDLRQQAPVHEGSGHAGAKNSRAVWLGDLDRIATAGFSKMSDRQLGLWDIRSPNEPISGFQMLDSISGVCMPFWDEGTSCLYLAGKGDGNIRYYEYANDDLVYLSEYKSADPQRGVAFVPKRGVEVHENEVMRAYKTVNDSYIEPISFIVPRRAETFQSDIYPETISGKAGLNASDWFEGKDAFPPKFDLSTRYSEDGTLQEAPSTQSYLQSESLPKQVVPTTVKSQAQTALNTISSTVSSLVQEASTLGSGKAETHTVDSKPILTTMKEKIIDPVNSAATASTADDNAGKDDSSIPSPDNLKSGSLESISPSVVQDMPKGTHSKSTELNTILSALQQLSTSLDDQARTIATQQDICSKLIKDVQTIKERLI